MSARDSRTLGPDGAARGANPASERTGTRLYWLAALLSLVGMADAVYLTVEHLAGGTVRCTVTAGCSEVLGSPYATVGGVPLAGLGALAYFAAFSLALLVAFGYTRARALLFFLVALMLLVTLWLLYLQAFVLHAFCQYCLLSAALTLALGLIVVFDGFILRRR
ncbi:MAG TPA: vitamin K epoxide reductase family protein [Pyrinomonadaceae bacterium]|jgi:uncharacterized membrane protein